MDWHALITQVVTQLGTAGVIIAILAVMGKSLVDTFSKAGVEKYKAELKITHDLKMNSLRESFQKELEQLKADLDRKNSTELEGVRHEFERQLAAEKSVADEKADRFHQTVQDEAAAKERVRAQIILWANPILNAVQSLKHRMENILDDEGYLALNESVPQSNPDWSVDYDYFLKSSLYLFAQYFCWIRTIELELSFELFRASTSKTAFFAAVVGVSDSLGKYPASPVYEGIGLDHQVFRLQQQAIGELMASEANGKRSCIGYAAFLKQVPTEPAASLVLPLRSLLNNVQPGEKRWSRLKGIQSARGELQGECETLLNLETVSAPQQTSGKP